SLAYVYLLLPSATKDKRRKLSLLSFIIFLLSKIVILLIAKAFWHHQHCWWFTGTNKNIRKKRMFLYI
ncbi:MAG: hypothetical protein IJ457_08345, partial [Clostridia bacterium]|nr:hypothetical protein [Clostridia bacterium]